MQQQKDFIRLNGIPFITQLQLVRFDVHFLGPVLIASWREAIPVLRKPSRLSLRSQEWRDIFWPALLVEDTSLHFPSGNQPKDPGFS